MERSNTATLMARVKGVEEMGFEIATRGKRAFKKSPSNIKKAILSPTEYSSVDILLKPCTLKILNKRIPGTNAR